jgi:flagellar assembly protein FliH
MGSRVIDSATPDSLGPAQWRTIPAPPSDSKGSIFPQRVFEPAAAQPQQQLEEVRQRGFSEGVAAARSKTEAEVGAALQRLSATIAGLIQLRQQVKEDAAGELVQLAIAISSRILHRELNVDPDAILGLARAALSKAQSKEIHRVRLHPSHEAPLRQAMAQLLPGTPVEIASDASLKPGDVIFETAHGQLDASVSTQLREIERGLADRVNL